MALFDSQYSLNQAYSPPTNRMVRPSGQKQGDFGKTLGGLSSLMGPQPLAGMQGRPPSPLNYEEQVAAQQVQRLDGDMGRYVGIGEGGGSAGPMLPEMPGTFGEPFNTRIGVNPFNEDGSFYVNPFAERINFDEERGKDFRYENDMEFLNPHLFDKTGGGFPPPVLPDLSQPYPYDPPLRPPTMPTPPPMPTPTPMSPSIENFNPSDYPPPVGKPRNPNSPPRQFPRPVDDRDLRPPPTTPMPGDVGYVPYGSRNNQLVPPGYEKPSFVQGLAGGGPVGNLSFVELLRQTMEN